MTETPGKLALRYFDGEYNCVQAVFKAILEHKGLYFDEATQLSAGFGAGITFSGQQCGAVSGGVMAIGVLVGKTISDVRKHKSETYRLSEEFLARFKEEFGTVRCDDLTGVNMGNGEEFNKALDEGVFHDVCPKYVVKAVQILLDLFPD